MYVGKVLKIPKHTIIGYTDRTPVNRASEMCR